MNPDEIDKAVAALKAQGAPDEAIHAYLRDTLKLQPVADGHHDYHAEFQSGALQKRMEGANARDMTSAHELDAAEKDVPTVAGGLANLAHAIPGAEALQAGARSVVRKQPYADAYTDIEHARESLPAAGRIVTELAGASPLAAVLPGGPVASSALYGGAEQALNADPSVGVGERALRTAGGAAAGALLGKGGEMAVTAGRAMLPTLKGPAANLLARQAARAKSAKALYGAAMKEGQGQTATTAIQQFVAEPDIAEIVTELQSTRPFQGVAAHDPAMLDAIYKTLSDRAAVVKKGLESISPNRPNIGRFRGEDVKMAQGDLLDAVSGGGSLPGPMPSYRAAVDDFARQSAEMDALRRGYDAIRQNASGYMPSGKNLTRTTPEAFAEFMAKRGRTAGERTAGSEGILGGTRDALAANPLTKGRRALGAAPDMLRKGKAAEQAIVDRLIKAGLLTLRVAP